MTLHNPEAFFAKVRAGLLGPTLSATEVSGCQAILGAMDGAPLSFTAYALGTAYLETAQTMQPVKEYGGPAYYFRMYDIRGTRPDKARELGNLQPGDGALFCGRGYPQMTGRKNYERADRNLGLNGALIKNPDLAMRADVAAEIMRRGMEEGWFTGKKFSSYLPAQGPATWEMFKSSRRIINGTDRAGDVADYSMLWQEALVVGLWTVSTT